MFGENKDILSLAGCLLLSVPENLETENYKLMPLNFQLKIWVKDYKDLKKEERKKSYLLEPKVEIS